jgi:NAD(P) transhydrogenase subunit alpha
MPLFGVFGWPAAISLCFFLVNIARYCLEKSKKTVKSPLPNRDTNKVIRTGSKEVSQKPFSTALGVEVPCIVFMESLHSRERLGPCHPPFLHPPVGSCEPKRFKKGRLFFMAVSPLISHLTILVLATFVGFFVVWRVTPALHSPLMAVTNAVSSVVIVGALLASQAWETGACLAGWLGFGAVLLCSVNIVGGFLITHRMLGLFSKTRKAP